VTPLALFIFIHNIIFIHFSKVAGSSTISVGSPLSVDNIGHIHPKGKSSLTGIWMNGVFKFHGLETALQLFREQDPSGKCLSLGMSWHPLWGC
jgi:hypothetical protein